MARTPVGRYRGALADRSAVELGIHAVKGLLARARESTQRVESLTRSCLVKSSKPEQDKPPLAKLPSVQECLTAPPATTINKVCGSSLKAVMLAPNSIRAGEYNVIVPGGHGIHDECTLFWEKNLQDGFR
ncbi:MAG: hypothetical protein Ct9H90mP16_08260 [Candidatus Poseidoniales archaeon]|nr:MAG: hypothetical protein Ct9H90mP16_08260 [Candidatus Poseidoniales archaeon]